MRQFGKTRLVALCLIFAAAFLVPIGGVQAYVGPGLGAGALVLVLGVIGSVLLAVFAILWYPLKRFLKKRKAAVETKDRQTIE